MPDDQNAPVGGAGQTHSDRAKFASDTVREKVGYLLAEAGGTLAAVNEDDRRYGRVQYLGLDRAAAYRRNMNSPPCASSLSSRMAPARGPSGTTATSRMRPICPSRMTRSDSGSPSAPSITR